MIFSHVLYQLSYLAADKKPARAFCGRERESLERTEPYRFSAPARLSGLHVSVTVQRAELFKRNPLPVALTWQTPPFGGV
jgi:hypothetical protein